jgi:anti-sigma regulatory factor (Ser/Thr protein kinase)
MGIYLRRTFPPTADAIPEARAFVKDTLGERVGDDTMADLMLALSELATNAVEHAGTPFEVVVDTDGRARIEVEDNSPHLPVLTRATPMATSGRGLAIVDELCDRWGVHVVQDTKCVWCERDLSAPGT